MTSYPVSPSNLHSGGPRKVGLYVYIKAITDVNVQAQTFTVKLHQYFQWAPTKNEYEDFQRIPMQYKPAFYPQYIPTNALEIKSETEEKRFGDQNPLHILYKNATSVWNDIVEINDDNIVYFAVCRKYDMVISSTFLLQKFPFDLQHLHIFYEPDVTMNAVYFIPTPIYSCPLNIDISTLASSVDYSILSPTLEFNSFQGTTGDKWCSATITLKLQRRWSSYILRVLLINGILCGLNLSIFCLDRYYNVNDRLNISMTLILAMSAFQYVVFSSIPPVPYLTIADRYVQSNFLYVLFIIIYSIIASHDMDGIAFYNNTNQTSFISGDIDIYVGIFFLFLWIFMQAYYSFIAFFALHDNSYMVPLSYTELKKYETLYTADVISIPEKNIKILYDKTFDDSSSSNNNNVMYGRDIRHSTESHIYAEDIYKSRSNSSPFPRIIDTKKLDSSTKSGRQDSYNVNSSRSVNDTKKLDSSTKSGRQDSYNVNSSRSVNDTKKLDSSTKSGHQDSYSIHNSRGGNRENTMNMSPKYIATSFNETTL